MSVRQPDQGACHKGACAHIENLCGSPVVIGGEAQQCIRAHQWLYERASRINEFFTIATYKF